MWIKNFGESLWAAISINLSCLLLVYSSDVAVKVGLTHREIRKFVPKMESKQNIIPEIQNFGRHQPNLLRCPSASSPPPPTTPPPSQIRPRHKFLRPSPLRILLHLLLEFRFLDLIPSYGVLPFLRFFLFFVVGSRPGTRVFGSLIQTAPIPRGSAERLNFEVFPTGLDGLIGEAVGELNLVSDLRR